MSFFKRFYFSLFIAVMVAVGSLITWYTYQNANEEATASLVARTDTIAQLIAEEDLSSLSYSEADLENPTYQRLKKHFVNARAVNEDVRFIYIFVLDKGSMKFVVDSEPADSPDYSPPGEVYGEAQEQPEIFEVFKTGEPLVQSAYEDRWGTWITGLSAIKDQEGAVKYVVGIDISATKFQLDPYLQAAFPAMLSLILVILAAAMYVVRKKELELVETRAQFISVASHELRSPLTGIRWGAENLLKATDLSTEKRTVVSAIHDSSLRLLSIVNDLLSIATAEHDFIDKKSFSSIDIKSLVKSSIDGLKATAASFDIRIDLDESSEELSVLGNAERLKNLVSNLISNAIKYSNNGELVTVAVGSHVNFNKKVVRIVIRDSGIGIPKEDIKKVLQGFYRSSNARIHTVSGTGLGLYICNKIAQLHDGNLTIDSLQGQGTMVVVSLPFYAK